MARKASENYVERRKGQIDSDKFQPLLDSQDNPLGSSDKLFNTKKTDKERKNLHSRNKTDVSYDLENNAILRNY